jgi:hypothetical protein
LALATASAAKKMSKPLAKAAYICRSKKKSDKLLRFSFSFSFHFFPWLLIVYQVVGHFTICNKGSKKKPRKYALLSSVFLTAHGAPGPLCDASAMYYMPCGCRCGVLPGSG